ncbi:hypothetical protein [Candidatus Electrothrix sp.]|uniref:hypothetical protein n=2 Tax=Candidatus Electrothrix sp. TaxID=2170559 RepID=UPI0040562A23
MRKNREADMLFLNRYKNKRNTHNTIGSQKEYRLFSLIYKKEVKKIMKKLTTFLSLVAAAIILNGCYIGPYAYQRGYKCSPEPMKVDLSPLKVDMLPVQVEVEKKKKPQPDCPTCQPACNTCRPSCAY